MADEDKKPESEEKSKKEESSMESEDKKEVEVPEKFKPLVAQIEEIIKSK